MVERSTGLILRTRPLTETSLIVHWLTPEFGRLATVAKGARRPKSPFRGKLDLFYLADFSFSRSRTSELHNLREIELRGTHEFLRRDLRFLQQAAYCVRLVEQTTEMETPLGAMFSILSGFLAALPVEAPRPQMVFGFEIKLLSELGLQPDVSSAGLGAATKALVADLDSQDWPNISALRLDSTQFKELHRFLHGFLIYHLGRIPKGRDAALESGAKELHRGFRG
jgi:DNA repair protein RecO (recombination protein O)